MLPDALGAGLGSSTLPTALYLLLGSLLATLLVVVLWSEAAERRLQRRRLPQPAGDGRPAQTLLDMTAVRLQLWAGGLTLLGQLLAMSSKSELQRWKDRAEASAVLVVIMLLFFGLPSWAPRFFQQRRCLIMAGSRLALWAQPWIVNPRGMQAVFQAQPSHGAAGLLSDVWRLLLGAQVLAMFVTPFVAPLPPLPHLALALFAFERCRTAAYICTSCPLLRHPIWHRRIVTVHRLIDKLPLLVPYQPPTCEAQLTAVDSAVAECRVFVTSFQVLFGVVLPTLIVARLHAPLHDAAVDEAEQGRRRLQRHLIRQPSSRGESFEWADQPLIDPAANNSSIIWRPRCGWPLPSVQAFASSAEGTLQHLCGQLWGSGPEPIGGWVLTAAVWWLLLSFCWVLAIALELPAAASSAYVLA